MPHDAASCSVLIQGDFLYTSTSNGVGGMQGETFFSKHAYVVRPEAPAIIVLDKHTGQLVARERAGISADSFMPSGLRPRVARSTAGRWSSLGAETDSATPLRPCRSRQRAGGPEVGLVL